jgi:hypothetical protein
MFKKPKTLAELQKEIDRLKKELNKEKTKKTVDTRHTKKTVVGKKRTAPKKKDVKVPAKPTEEKSATQKLLHMINSIDLQKMIFPEAVILMDICMII